MSLKFIYFDLGRVIIHFDVDRMIDQVAEVARIDREAVRRVLFDERLMVEHERGLISSRQFYEAFCHRTGTQPPYGPLAHAVEDIFWLNASMVPVVAQVRAAGWRLGILSNTCQLHFEYCLRRFRLVDELFDTYALSFQIHALKPEPAIFLEAARLAGVEPSEMLFIDDLAGHVEGARRVGVEAIQYTSTPELAAELRRRGIRFNY